MKPVLLLAAGMLAALALPALAQTDAGTPPLSPNMTAPLPQVLKLPGTAQPGTLTTSKAQYRSGQPVRMTFKVANTSGKSVTYNFGSGQRYDITATNAAGTQVWSWSHGKLFTQNLSSLSVAPGKALIYHAVWNGRDASGRSVPPGAYTLSAHLTSDNQPAITGGVIVNTDPDPDNLGVATRTPAESGTIRQVAPAAQVSAKTTITIK
jgi:hypothetical protein